MFRREPPRPIPSSGVFTRPQPEPTAYEVRRVDRGYGLFAVGRERALSVHPTIDDAIKLAEALGKRVSARIDVRAS